MNCGTRSVGRQFVPGYIAVPRSRILLEPFYGSSVDSWMLSDVKYLADSVHMSSVAVDCAGI